MCSTPTTMAQSEFIYAAFCGQGCDIDRVIDQYFTQERVLRFYDVNAGRFPSGSDMPCRIYETDSVFCRTAVIYTYYLMSCPSQKKKWWFFKCVVPFCVKINFNLPTFDFFCRLKLWRISPTKKIQKCKHCLSVVKEKLPLKEKKKLVFTVNSVWLNRQVKEDHTETFSRVAGGSKGYVSSIVHKCIHIIIT